MSKEEIEELKDFTIDLTDIDELALGLEVCSKKSNMVIQEFADTIIQLQQENKQLNGAIQTYDILLKANVEENKQLKDKIPYIIQNNSCKYISIEKCKNKVCVNYEMRELKKGSDNQ